MKASQTTRKLTTIAMLAAVSIVLVALIRIPFPPAPFLEYDPADIPIFICTFLYGPVAGLGLTLVVSVIQGTTVSAGSGIIGIVMHFLATGAFALLAGNLYRLRHNRVGAVVALGAGVAAMTVVMVFCNLIFTPIFMGTPIEAVIPMLLPVIIPFNLLKAGVNGIVTYFAYKPIARLVKHEHSEQPA